MKKALTGPDIRELVYGWQSLVGSRVDQFGRPELEKLIFKLRNIDKGTVRIVIDFRGWAYLTTESFTTESNQGVFVNQVRKSIKKSRLDSIEQLNGDRIISFSFIRKESRVNLILELFHKGNAILCENGKIITVMKQQKFRHRTLRIGEEYVAPPGFNPFDSDIKHYEQKLINSERNLGASLTINCNLGGEIANLICHKLGLNPDSKVNQSNIKEIYSEINNVLNDKIKPTIFLDKEDNKITVSPYNLSNLVQGQVYSSFDDAIKEFISSIKEPVKIVKDKEDNRISKQKQAIRLYIKKSGFNRKIGNLIFTNIDIIQKAIEENEESGKFNLNLEGFDISLDSLKSAEANGSLYFDKAKELKRKAERTKEVLASKPKKSKRLKLEKQKLEWFEKYRWFITSNGEIAIGGKDATSNERIVKKYLKKNDRYAHADIHGAPSVVVKNEKGEPPSSKSMLEASSFSLAYSKAWEARVASGHSFWVDNDKVSKTPNTGEFLAKGAFVIRGKRNWHKNLNVELCVGLISYNEEEKLMGGPVSSFKNKSKKYVVFKPGFSDRRLVSRKLSSLFNVELSLVEKLLPSGGFEIVKAQGIEIKLDNGAGGGI